jgi:hypothetical protein
MLSLRIDFCNSEDFLCSVCLEGKLNDEIVYHQDGGEKHPVHKMCAKKWFLENENCPVCRVDVDTRDVLTLKERTIKVLQSFFTHNRDIGFVLLLAIAEVFALKIGAAIGNYVADVCEVPKIDSWRFMVFTLTGSSIGMLLSVITIAKMYNHIININNFYLRHGYEME